MSPAPEISVRLNEIVAALLRYGTWCASVLIACGMILEARHLAAGPLVRAGVALFILLPVARLALMLAIFLRERDYVYALISALVLSIIAAGVAVGASM
jgi:uncharacterized membrane protein